RALLGALEEQVAPVGAPVRIIFHGGVHKQRRGLATAVGGLLVEVEDAVAIGGEGDGFSVGRPRGIEVCSSRKSETRLHSTGNVEEPQIVDATGEGAAVGEPFLVGRKPGGEVVALTSDFASLFAAGVEPQEPGAPGKCAPRLVSEQAIVGDAEGVMLDQGIDLQMVGQGDGIADEGQFAGVETLCQQGTVAHKEQIAGRGVKGGGIDLQHELWFSAIERSSVGAGLLPIVGANKEQEMFSVGEKLRPAVGGILAGAVET